MKFLRVEDETKTGQYLQQGLTESGFSAVHITNSLDAVHEIAEGDYALIILDVMLPGLNGWEVLREIRRLGYSMTDKTSNHTSQSTETFSRLNLTAFASIRNAVCAINGALNDNFLLKTGPICLVGSVGQHLSRTHLSA
jgi:CheY-like chemotaxis protein